MFSLAVKEKGKDESAGFIGWVSNVIGNGANYKTVYGNRNIWYNVPNLFIFFLFQTMKPKRCFFVLFLFFNYTLQIKFPQ